MDANELARQTAKRLHDLAVENGFDPCQPYDFVLAEAERHELDVQKTHEKAPILRGGRAVLRHKKMLIVHENKGSDFEQAFLVAHEIGHFVLGDNPDDEGPCNIEPDRSAEPPRIGMDRVTDYGPKQRREVQMDLFAREFLLPRRLVNKLHIEEGLTASQIAERYGASFDVVIQQLIDSLLPIIDLPPLEKQIEYNLNQEQQRAVEHRGKALLLEAGPGTGKTQTLTARVESLLNEHVSPQNILVLTYSNKAASEMASRIACKNKEAAVSMFIGTFHAFGLELLHQFYDQIDLPKVFPLLERADAVDLLMDEFPRLGLKHFHNLYDPTYIIDELLTAVLRAKDELIDADNYQQYADQLTLRAENSEQEEAASRAQEIAKFYTMYEKVKNQSKSVDFGDLLLLPVRLLKNNDSVREQIAEKYQHILVDEYQDVNRSSVELISVIRSNGDNLWVVGDARQSIYRFRGASSINMAYFGKRDFPGGIKMCLKVNYRSHSEVVDALSTYTTKMQISKDKNRVTQDSIFESAHGSNGMFPEHVPLALSQHLPMAIADGVKEMLAANFRFQDQAILCTNNEKLSILARDLERLDIPVLFLGSLFERPEIKNLLALLSLLVDPWGMGLVRAACLSEFQMSLEEVALTLQHFKQIEGTFLSKLNNRDSISGLSDKGKLALNKLADAFQGLEDEALPWKVLGLLLFDRTRFAAKLAASEKLADRSSCLAIWQFMNFARSQPQNKRWPMREILERIRRLVRYRDDYELRELPAAAQGIDAVRLMTIHKAKGLQFPVVHIAEVNADNLPYSWRSRSSCPPIEILIHSNFGGVKQLLRSRHDEEQECLFYVALSRARSKIFLYSPKKQSNGWGWRESPFVGWLGNTTKRRPQPKYQSQTSVDLGKTVGLLDPRQIFEASQLALYTACPRQFYYTYVLKIGGKRNTNAYLKMHEVVRKVLEPMTQTSEHQLSEEDLQKRIVAAFESSGLAEHGYAMDYQAAANNMVKYYLETRQGFNYEEPKQLRVSGVNEEIFVQPDEVLVLPDGRRRFRRIRTGQRRFDKAVKGIEAAALVSATRQAFLNAEVEWVHLANKERQVIKFFEDDLKVLLNKLQENLQKIKEGYFPAKPESAKRCPGCPAFFICGSLPEEKKN